MTIIRLGSDYMANCLQCGAPLKVSFRKSAKFCSRACCNKYHYKKKGGYKKQFCVSCGKELSGRQTKYCSEECQKKTLASRLYAQRKEEFEEFKEYKKPMPKKRTKPKMSIAKVNELARAEGLNYGQYVAKYGL
jgi:hypothetical protein